MSDLVSLVAEDLRLRDELTLMKFSREPVDDDRRVSCERAYTQIVESYVALGEYDHLRSCVDWYMSYLGIAPKK